MEEVMDVMEKNYDNSEFGLQELADALGVSRSKLSKNLQGRQVCQQPSLSTTTVSTSRAR